MLVGSLISSHKCHSGGKLLQRFGPEFEAETKAVLQVKTKRVTRLFKIEDKKIKRS